MICRRRLHQACFATMLLGLFALLPSLLSGRDIIEAGAANSWKFLDERSAPPDHWRQAGFDDSKWNQGPAPLGYGEARLGTTLHWGADTNRRPITAWFRREFIVPESATGQPLVLVVCLDDGAVIYLNGKEVVRADLPPGPIAADTPALHEVSDLEEGFYRRIPLPSGVVRPGATNLLAVEVHQASANSDDLYFDLALKTLPPNLPATEVPSVASEVMNQFHQRHFIGPGVPIPDGYVDGGRRMRFDDKKHPISGREILLVDRTRDLELTKELALARSAEVRALPPLERVQRLAAAIDAMTTPPGGARWVGPTIEQITHEFANKPLLIGDVVDQGQAGVCRHRALLFKILADEAGLKAALVRGNYIRRSPPGFPHAWNEVTLDDGRRVLVDVMLNGGNPKFLEITNAAVIAHYARENDSPWYGLKADAARPAK